MDSQPDLDAWRRVADPEADEVVRAIGNPHEEAVCALPKLIGRWNVDDPQGKLPVQAWDYLHRPMTFPAWVDLDRVARAQTAYQEFATAGELVLGLFSLPVLYIDPGIARVLMQTGRLVLQVRRRLDETRDFVRVVMSPGSLASPGNGWKTIRKIRLTHAVVRGVAALGRRCEAVPGPHFLAFTGARALSRSRDDTIVAGAPSASDAVLNQVQLAYTLLTFSWVMVAGLSTLAVPMRGDREREDHVYVWTVVGHMLGVVDELLPGHEGAHGTQAARVLFERIRSELLAPGDPIGRKIDGAEEGRQLMAALLVIALDLQRETIPTPFRGWVERCRWLDIALQDLPRTLVRMLCGVRTAQQLHVGRAPFLHWLVCRLALRVLDLKSWKLPSASVDEAPHIAGFTAGLF